MDLKEYRDRVSGCWLGKNIGGTLGMPMEWERKKNNVTYYTHDITGEPLPNDDLDIQILWLLALEEKGIDVDAKVLGEYFNEYMIFTHAEYGTAKTNLRAGLQPPVSGSFNNSFKDSCGSYIRQISGHASIRAVRSLLQSMPLKMPLLTTETGKGFMPRYLLQQWKALPFMKRIYGN